MVVDTSALLAILFDEPEQEALREGAQAPCGGELGAVAVRICPRREALNRGRFPRGIYPKRRGISR